MPQGVILDFGGVLTKVRPRNVILRRCEEELGLPKGALMEVLFSGEHWYAVSTGRASPEEYWQCVRHALGGHVPAVLAPFRDSPFAYEELNQRMIALVRRLHRTYTTALLSNATPSLDSLLADHGLTVLFDVIVNSSRVGLRKPDPTIYQLTVEQMGLLPEQCLFVDDKERNIAVARALGMQAILFRSAAHLARYLQCLEHQGGPRHATQYPVA